MARNYVDDGEDIFRVRVFDKEGQYWYTYGPYETVGKAKAQGSRETGTSMRATRCREGSYMVQKLEAVLEWEDYLEGENDIITLPVAQLKWIDVDV